MKTLVHTDKEKIEKIIRSCQICFVGMTAPDGSPYVIPMNFGYRDNTVYLHSAPEGSSISMLEADPRVCISFCTDTELVFQNEEVACSYRMRSGSVIGWGNVLFEEDYDLKVEALNIIMNQYSEREFAYGGPSVVNVKIWKVKLDKVTCKEFGAPHKPNMAAI